MPNSDDFYNRLKFDLKSHDSVFMDHRQGAVGFSACKKWEPTDPSFDCNHEEEEKVWDVAYGIHGRWFGKHEK